MKRAIDIRLTTVHSGRCRRVVTLGLNGKDLAYEFLADLARKNSVAFRKLATRMRIACEQESYENETAFKSLGGGLYKFKTHRPAIRLYAFYDDLEDEKLIIAACGGGKGNQQQGIKTAHAARTAYLQACKAPNTTVELVE